MTREEVFVPALRSRVVGKEGTGSGKTAKSAAGMDLDELLEDAPIYRLYYLLVQQLFGWPAYLIMNASGQEFYPKWTNRKFTLHNSTHQLFLFWFIVLFWFCSSNFRN